jgi:hypothetical protein
VLDINFQAGGPQLRNYGTGKLKRAMDLALDKFTGSKYSLIWEVSSSEGAKSPKNGDVKPWGQCRWGEESRVAVWLLTLRLGWVRPKAFFCWSCMDVEGDFDHKNSGNNLQAGLKVY